MSKVPDLVRQRIGIKPLDRFDDIRVERTPSVVEHASVRDLVGQGVLERVFRFREELCLVEKVGGLKINEAVPQLFFRHLGDRLEQGEGNILANDCCDLE